MTNEPEKRNDINQTNADGAEKPKKKKPIMIFRPQNSKTGMVKSGSRPGAPKRPGQPGQAGSRPAGAGATGTRPAGTGAAAGTRPAGSGAAAGTRPAGTGAAAGTGSAGAAGAAAGSGQVRRNKAARTPEAQRAAEYAAKMAAKEAEEKAARAAREAAAAEAAAKAEAERAARQAELEAKEAEERAAREAAAAARAAKAEAEEAARKAAAEAANAGQTATGQTGAGQTGAGQTGAGQTGAGQAETKQAGAGQAGAAQESAGVAQAGAGAGQAGAGTAQTSVEAGQVGDQAEAAKAGQTETDKTAQAGKSASVGVSAAEHTEAKQSVAGASTSGTSAAGASTPGTSSAGARRTSSAAGSTGAESVSSRDGASARPRRDDQTAGRSSQGTAGRTGFTSRTGAGSTDRPARPERRDSREGFSARTDRGPRRDGSTGFDSGRGAGAGRPSRDGAGAGRPAAGAGAGRPSFSRDGSRDASRDGFRDGAGRGDRQGGRSFAGAGAGSRAGGSRGPVAADTKPFEKEGRARNDRGKKNAGRPEKADKFDRLEGKAAGKNAGKPKNGAKAVKPVTKPVQKEEEKIKSIVLPETITLKDLADKLKINATAIVKKLFMQGKMVTVNEEIDYDQAEEIAMDYDVLCEKEVKVDVIEELLKEEPDPEETLKPRPPVVCVMGHVDHGKTSLLDAIRNTHVIDREAGGITQHIGASVVKCNGQLITFLDTPGHEAFTAMRMRGANSTDIAILVVAADDGVMPQTVEAINHARAAGIEIIVAINKIDKPAANVDKVKQELTEYQLIPEDWGGSTVFVPVSAKTGEGIDNLLEMILLTSEVLELKANPDRRARGLIIEARLDKGRGPVATVLVQKGTLHLGDPICAGACHGRIRAMLDDKGNNVTVAGPSTPVEIVGFSDVPGAGEILISPETEKEARSFAETFHSEERQKLIDETKHKMSLDDLFTKIQEGKLKELNLIVKADVQGSVEAVKQSLVKLSNDEVVVKVIHSGAGAINESDVVLASASDAIIIGFNVPLAPQAKNTAEQEGVDIRLYTVIYNAIEDVERAMKGMLDPIFEEKILGHAEVRQTFRASGVGTIAGCYVLDGIFQRGCSARITRDGKQIFEGAVASLKRFKDDVKEVKAGYECGLVFEKFNDLQEGDQVEAFAMVEVPRS